MIVPGRSKVPLCIVLVTLVIGTTAFASQVFAAVAGTARPEACSLPPRVDDRIGRAQEFVSQLAKAQLVGKRDVIWGDRGAAALGVYAMSYLPVDRDPDRNHTLAWYEASHPNWVARTCSGQPANSFSYPFGYLTPILVAREDVRQYLFASVSAGLISHRYQALGVDNLQSVNRWGRCGSNGNHGVYSGNRFDPAFVKDMADWLGWLRASVHAVGACLAGNLHYNYSDPQGYNHLAAQLDIVVDEGGFTRNCKPFAVRQQWLDRFLMFSEIARKQPLIILDKACPTVSGVTSTVQSWSLANYLLIKGERTYLAINTEDARGGFIDFPALYLATGSPLGAVEKSGPIYYRKFQSVIAIVNPESRASSFELGHKEFKTLDGTLASGTITVPAESAAVLSSVSEKSK